VGECGCGNTRVDFVLPGPGNVVYGVQLYPSCTNCDTPAGVQIYRWDAARDPSAPSWYEDAAPAPWNPYDKDLGDGADICVPVVTPEALLKSLAKWCKDNKAGVGDDGDDYGSIEDLLADALPECLHDAACAVGNEWLKKIRGSD